MQPEDKRLVIFANRPVLVVNEFFQFPHLLHAALVRGVFEQVSLRHSPCGAVYPVRFLVNRLTQHHSIAFPPDKKSVVIVLKKGVMPITIESPVLKLLFCLL